LFKKLKNDSVNYRPPYTPPKHTLTAVRHINTVPEQCIKDT